ncbi:MAG: putative porin [Bacteroidota bacterium]
MRLKTALAILSILSAYFSSSASSPDSAIVTVPTSIRYIHELDFRDGNPNFHRPDTSLYHLDRVHIASDNNYNYLGVPGSAAQSPWFVNMSEILTRTTIRSYDIYHLKADSVRYYSVNKKFTDIDYHNGTFKEQVIDIVHTQNVLKIWNVGFSFGRFSVKDYMFFSDTYKGDFLLFTSLRSNNSKYNLFAHAYWNSIENQMNGGLSSDSAFVFGNVDNVGLRGLGWKISDAKQTIRTKRFNLSQYYDFGGTRTDSVGKITSIPSLRFNHNITFERTTFAYSDETPDSTFYSNFYNSTSTDDSLHSDHLRNEIAIILPADKQRSSAFFQNWSLSAAIEHQTTRYEQKNKYTWENIAASGKIISKYDSSDFNATVSSKYVLSGRDNGNFQTDVEVKTKQYLFGSFGGKISVGQYSPDFYLLEYYSNNFAWQNEFSKIKSNSLQLNYSLLKYRIAITASRMQFENSPFINSEARPEQLEKKLIVDQLKIEKTFKYKTIHFLNSISFQKNDNEDKIHLSPFFSQHALYFEKAIFGNKLLMSTGFNFAYSATYFSDDFMPATALFYYQDSIKTGGYLRADLFLRAKIKSAQIFLKMENVGDNIGKKTYFLVPHYAQPGMVFRFGVTWRFFDQ